MYEIVVYKDTNGSCPYAIFREDVRRRGDKKAIAIIDAVVTKLREVGLDLLGTKMMDNIGDGIYELRPGNYRVFCFYDRPGNRFVLLHGFRKETKKTPNSQKIRARSLSAAYQISVRNLL